jgi:FAD/FMN-containing dehydrogenase
VSTRVEGSLDELRRSFAGTVLGPTDPGYDEARRCFNALVDRRPAVIARVAGSADVAAAFDFARGRGLEIAVRGGGHNPAGHCILDDGLVIDLSQLRSVEVDPGAGIARAAGGATWIDFDTASQAHGLVTPGGVVGSTGVAGLTLGGGIGHLTSQHGLTCDNLVGAELVSPDGSVTRASSDENAELLWGLRGGGGNFGVATRLDFRLHPLERVVGGLVVYRGSSVRDVLRTFRDVAASSPRDLSCQAVLMVDESAEPQLVVSLCHTGPNADSEALRLLRSGSGLVSDGVRERPYLDQQLLFDSPYGENRHYWKGHFVRELPDELIDALIQGLADFGRPPVHVLVESLHGAPKDADARLAGISYREAAFNVSAMAVWDDPRDDDAHIRWARETATAIEPWSLGGGYANYMQADEPLERVRAAFGEESFERLQALKSRFDPENVLRRNQNIPPAASSD